MKLIQDYIETLTDHAEGFTTAGPKSLAKVASLERALAVTLPPSYRDFLQRYGAVSHFGSYICGIWHADPLRATDGSVYNETIQFRTEDDLPAYLIVIEADPDAPCCIDTRKPSTDGECPVVCYDLHARQSEQIAANFEAFAQEWLELRAMDESEWMN